MKSQNFVEFNSYVDWCRQLLEGAQLQDTWADDQTLVLEFYKFRSVWLVCELQMPSPQLVLLQNEQPPVIKKSKPIVLFLQSHGRNLRVENFTVRPELGRVAELILSGGGKELRLEMQLIPKSVNVLARTGDKKISWDKPREQPLVTNPTTEKIEGLEGEWLARETDWLNSRKKISSPKANPADPEKIRLKKQKAIETLRQSLESFDSQKWKDLGEFLKSKADLPSEFENMIDTKLSRSENIDRAFQKAKDVERKKAGTQERIAKIQNEIDSPILETKRSPSAPALEKADARGRKLLLGQGIEAIYGRSAKDNLAILRQARAWDLWMHLKDYPGAHAIIFRERNVTVETSLIEKAALWLIAESPAAKGFAWGAKYDVVVVETRFVRPIKGDSLGRVTYQNPKVYTFASVPKKV